ncbi:MAG TPA: M20/M25/M40 family metallo-hydrolase [Bryobacteraceae bacterium]|nr:M20/M25/M40 family metallo-hydrolase [Bryobacteraceae bacterium]
MATPAANAVNSIGDLAESRGLREALQHFTREKQWVNDIHLQLCRIAAPTFHELPRAEWMAAQFRSLGWHAGIDSEGNVLASLDPQPSGSLIAISAHLDTVLAPRIKDDISFDPQGVLLGPGVSDNGAGLAALLAIARAIQQAPAGDDVWRRILLIANTGEEGEGNLRGIRHLCSQPALISRILAFLILDGAALDHITINALGSRRFEVTFSGPGGHSWSDFGIGNPVHALSRAVAGFVDSNPIDPRATPRVSVNAGLIEGGSGINAIPAQARVKIDIRSEDETRIDALAAALQDAVARAEETENSRVTGGRVTARVREIGRRPAGRLDDRAPLLATLRAVDAHLGIRARPDCASTDANIPLSMGIPAVSIGAGGHGGGAHTTSEWYRPAGRDLGLKRILLTAAALLAGTAAP